MSIYHPGKGIPEKAAKSGRKIYHMEVKFYGSTAQFNSDEREQNVRSNHRDAGKVL